jgi:hypothetical protein
LTKTLKSVRLYTNGGRDVLVSIVDDPADPDGRRIEVEPPLDPERLQKVLLVGELALASDRPEQRVEVLLDAILGVASGGDTRHRGDAIVVSAAAATSSTGVSVALVP